MLIDPVAFFDVIDGVAQHHAVADDLTACGDVTESNLVGLGNVLVGSQVFHDPGSGF